jgi:hypothetical protein
MGPIPLVAPVALVIAGLVVAIAAMGAGGGCPSPCPSVLPPDTGCYTIVCKTHSLLGLLVAGCGLMLSLVGVIVGVRAHRSASN